MLRFSDPRRAFAFGGAALLILAVAATLHGQQPGTAAPAGPMAPEKYKNIQVLTDVPADQLDLTMRYIVAATGIQCTGCHVTDAASGALQPEKDDRPAKKTARQMMNLVKTINAGDFGARISCGTCHAGRNQPAGLQTATAMTPEQIGAAAAQAAALAAARQGAPGGPGGAAGGGRGAQPPAVPVDDVLAKYFEAVGGRAALDKVQARTMSGTVTNRMAESAPFIIEEKAGKFRQTVQAPASPTTLAFDGTNGWQQTATRTSALAGFSMEQVARDADLALVASLKTKYPNLATGRATRLPATSAGGAPVAVNVLQATNGYVTEQFMFDAASGLLLRKVARTATGLRGSLVEQVDYSDYRDVNGVKMPFQITRSNWNTFDTFKVSDIKVNTAIADARFARPN